MFSNKILDEKITVQPSEEPVTLQEVKEFMNVDFTEKDDLIASLITAARTLLEEKYDIGIAKKTLKITLDNSRGGIQLPKAPIGSVTAVDRNGASVTITVVGDDHKYIECPECSLLVATYECGYAQNECPEIFKSAIKQQVLWMFENLGDKDMGSKICPMAEASLAPFRTNGYGVFI